MGQESCCSRIKEGKGSLTQGEDEVRMIWKDLFYIDIQEQVAVYICSFDGIHRGKYFGEELLRRTEVGMRRMEKLQVR